MKRIALVASGALLALVSWIGGPATAPVAHADPLNVATFNQSVCIALAISAGAGVVVNTCGQTASLEYSATQGSANIDLVAGVLGGTVNQNPTPADFAGVSNFSGGQIHQQSGATGVNHLTIVAFVASLTPVTFHTTAGFFLENGSSVWTCDGTGTGPAADPDCGGPAGPAPKAPDGVVVANIVCTAATCPILGPQQLTVEQGGIVFPVNFTVVGEARSVEFFTPKTSALQAGVFVNGPLNATSAALACPFSATLAFITQALGEAEKTVLVARALDINGTAISGAWINWSVDDASTGVPVTFDTQGIMAQATTPTLNLGGFGYGAPNILCANSTAVPGKGKITVTARLTRSVNGGAIVVDPQADPGTQPNVYTSTQLASGMTSFDMVGLPAKVTLAAAPASIPCDGTTTSTVTAAITDAAGNIAAAGTAVHFDTQVLGTANPINATTDKNGVATSVITPLSAGENGVPVTVSVMAGGVAQPNLTQQVLVQCNGAPPAGTAPAGGGAGAGTGPAPAGGGATGTIIGPNTGMDGVSAGAGRLSWWPVLLLAMAAAALGTARLAFTRRQR